MAAKIFALCTFVLLVQTAAGQCWGRGLAAPCGARLGYAGYGPGYGAGYGCDIAAANSLNAAYGGILKVSSASPVPPTGINVASDNVYEGPLAVVGNLPFLGTVAVEGEFPTVGAGGISYRCGDSTVGITGEGTGISASTAAGLGYADLGYNGLGYGGLSYNGLGYAGHGGCGCGGLGYSY